MARMFGQFAVQTRHAGGQQAPRGPGQPGPPARRRQRRRRRRRRRTRPGPSRSADVPPSSPRRRSSPSWCRSASELAITDYDSLSASQVVPRLEGLSAERARRRAPLRGRPPGSQDDPLQAAPARPSGVDEAARPATAEDIAGRSGVLFRAATEELREQRGGDAVGPPAQPRRRLRAARRRPRAGRDDRRCRRRLRRRPDRAAGGRRPSWRSLDDIYVEAEAPGRRASGSCCSTPPSPGPGSEGASGSTRSPCPGMRDTKNFFEAAGLVARAIVVHKRL